MRKFVIKTSDDFNKFLKHFNSKVYSLDTETTSLLYTELEIEGFSICDGKLACYVPLADYAKEYKNPEHDEILLLLKELFDNAESVFMANAPFDLKVLYKYGIGVEKEPEVIDIQVLQHLLEEEDNVGLKYLAQKYLGVETTKYMEIEDHSSKQFFEYAINDAVWTFEIGQVLLPRIKEDGMTELYRRVEAPFQYVLRDMAINGMKVNVPKVKELSKKAQVQLNIMYQELCQLADIQKEYVRVDSQVEFLSMREYPVVAIDWEVTPSRGMELFSNEYRYTCQSGKTWEKTKWKIEKWDYAFNFNSAKQLGDLLFNKMGLKVIEFTPTNQPKVGKNTLEKYKDNPFVKKLSVYKKMYKLQTSYLCDDGQILSNLESDGRVRPNIRDTGTATGRLSMNSPNCFSGDTEVLTYYGWFPIKDMEQMMGQSVATYNTLTKEIEFQKPVGEFIKGTTDKMYHIHNTHIDIMCTENHRHLQFNRKTGKQLMNTTLDFNIDAKMLNAAPYTVLNPEEPNIQRLVCAIQADGSITSQGYIDFSFTKKRKYNRLLEIISGLEYRDYSNQNRYRVLLTEVPRKVWRYLYNNKTYQPYILQRFDNVFFEELRYWDGLITRQWGERYCSVEESNVDLVQALCTLRGYRSLKSKDLCRVHVTNRDYSLTSNITIDKVYGDLQYYCITVPNDTLITRRNGKVTINHQCQQLPKGLCLSCGAELEKCSCGFTGNLPVRSCFIVDDDSVMITCDYSGQEIAVAAQQSKDPTLVDALNKGQDMHLKIANQFYNLGIPEEALYETSPLYKEYKDKFKVQRTQAKVITFGLMYGKSGFGFAKDFDISEDEAQEIVDKYFAAMPTLYDAIKQAHAEIDACGTVTSMAGRKRHFEQRMQWDGQVGYDKKAYRQAFNFLIQGFSADMIRMAMNKVREVGKEHPEWNLRAVGTVHDESIYEVKKLYQKDAETAIKTAFENVVSFCVPVNGSIGVGDNYDEAK